MSRDVCGICWCPYDDDGKCGCEHTPLVNMDAFRLGYDKGADDTRRRDHERINDEALLRQALEALEACLGWPQTIEALRERLK